MHLPSLLLCFVASVTGVSAGSPNAPPTTTQPILFAGTYTRDEGWVNGTGKGIYTYKLNTNDGSLTPWAATPVGINPVYVLSTMKNFNTGERVIYAINAVNDEIPKNSSKLTGYISALTLNDDGTLELLNTLETKGGSPTHISLSPQEDFVLVSNYGGSLAMFPINEDGSLADMTFHEEFPTGSGVVKDQQATGHTHSTTWLPNSEHFVTADLGRDELLQYKLVKEEQTVTSLEIIKRPPGSGPRHMAIHPDGHFAYVVDEISSTVGVYQIDEQQAVLSTEALQDITTLPSDFTNTSTGGDIHLSSNGHFLYASNRGHDSIAIFKIKADGTLASLGWESSRGKAPRGFVIYGKWLIVANQNSNNMHVFEVDSETGLLSFTGNSYDIGTAVCLHIAEF